MNIADLLPQLVSGAPAPGPGAIPPVGPDDVPLPLVPPGAPLPAAMPGLANASTPGLGTGNFPTPSPSSIATGGGPAPRPAPGAGGSGPAEQGIEPPHPDYTTITQTDGSVVMFMKNPDGSRGPAVKIISPPKRGLNRAAAMAQVK